MTFSQLYYHCTLLLNQKKKKGWKVYFMLQSSLCYQYQVSHVTKPDVLITAVTEATFRSWFTTPVLVFKCHLAASGKNGAQITDWFFWELCWMWYWLHYLTSYLNLFYSLCVRLWKTISFIPLLHKNPINFSSLLSLGKFLRREIWGRFVTF